MTSNKDIRLPVVLTMGEPSGIAPEITLKAWLARDECSIPAFFVAGDADLYRQVAGALGMEVPVEKIREPREAKDVFSRALPVLSIALKEPSVPGSLSPANASAVLSSIDLASDLALDAEVSAIVTNPIHKRALYEAGFNLPGHTEYLAGRCGGATPVMMLSCPGLRVVPVTVHLSLGAAVAALSAEAIVEQGQILAQSLIADFGIKRPRIAVAALNPHAGEEGHLGREEIEVIAPAIKTLRTRVPEAEIRGPAPADTLFHAAARESYDAVLCMYHDQALIPLKTIDFERGVNTTLGLPIVRTSPDHGTALDIAGRGQAHAGSLIEAILTADLIARHRSSV
ncbi:4-hydroxythreonine-4-phosphate dehydrogenase PdxA [Parvibaculum sp.]|jgi:4-hydroxythreonine-4-phosphate dehydrogenase|uniref:4-hydroxythreonine-4-phosphate dehydrogenase PdxA n=1 Tax=Parvibaculum sp. TaxID=2024848 RepID=UPI000C35FA2B|nr:4-hydroxythreonine-4-phosphate dehydrogenase PdxA [Parvibaculum sp.]MAM96184.1 4-hydroxythreonine-4-phosphate dehydrogenase PdxA [Parvibaculum sp.]|tara:strand:- start:2393 stop:3415 length:1023 start_codon:yes stop_codon:yes gene_type:complete